MNSDVIYGFPLASHYTRLNQCPLSPKLWNRQSLLTFSDLPFQCLSQSPWSSAGLSALSRSSNIQKPTSAPPGHWLTFPVSVHSHSLPYRVLAYASNSVRFLDSSTLFLTILLCLELLASLEHYPVRGVCTQHSFPHLTCPLWRAWLHHPSICGSQWHPVLWSHLPTCLAAP